MKKIFFFVLLKLILNKFFSSDLQYNKVDSKYYIELKFNNDMLKNTYYLTQTQNFTWYSNITTLKESHNIISDNNTISIKNKFYQNALHIVNTITHFDFKEQFVKNFHSYLLNTSQTIDQKFSLGLQRIFSDYNFSLTHVLKNNEVIDTAKYFLVIPSVSESENKIIFGSPPTFQFSGLENISLLADNNSIFWETSLVKIEELDLNSKVRFDVYENDFFVSKKFFDYLITNQSVFSKLIKDEDCSYNNVYNFYFLSCSKKVVNEIKSTDKLHFEFDNNLKFSIPLKEFFTCFQYHCDVKITFNKNNTDTGIFIFGKAIMKHFITVFNYEDNSITLFGEPSLFKKEKNIKIEKVIFCVLFFLILVGNVNVYYSVWKVRE